MAIDIQNKLVRNSLCFKGYDYSQPGAYFVTICTENRICYLGNIVDGITISLPISDVVREIWLEIPEKFHFVDLDAFIIMPNHFHGIVIINKECRDLIHQTRRNNSENICGGLIHQIHIKDYIEDSEMNFIKVGKIIRYFKARTAKIIHDKFFASFQWQRNYYEHVVRSPRELNSIREYIINNPLKWALDRENRLSTNFNMDLDNYFKEIFEK
jgi:putative transposase